MVEELKQKFAYQKEIANSEGTTWQTYERDSLWAGTTISNDGTISKYIIRIGNYKDLATRPHSPSNVTGTWVRTGDGLEEGTYQSKYNEALTISEKLNGILTGTYLVDNSENEITIAYNMRFCVMAANETQHQRRPAIYLWLRKQES